MKASPGAGSLLIVIPAYNEEGAIGPLLDELRATLPGTPVLVVDDCSYDSTVTVARDHGAQVVALPNHLGLGGAVQAGYRLAWELGYDYVIRVDGDGQHDPADIPRLFEALRQSRCQMVIGSRFLDGGLRGATSFSRLLAILFFRAILRPILGKQVYDPTSGFVGVNRQALEVFARSFPLEYPEIEALVVLQRRAFDFVEVPCRMRPRQAGRSTITPAKSLTYMIHVLLGVFVNILRLGERRRGRRAAGSAASEREEPQRRPGGD